MTKYVFSSTLKVTEWDNSVLRNGSAITEAATLKDKARGNLLIWGPHSCSRGAYASRPCAPLLNGADTTG